MSSFILRAIWLIFEAQATSSHDINSICSRISQNTQIPKAKQKQNRFFLSTLKPVVIKHTVTIKDAPGDDRRNLNCLVRLLFMWVTVQQKYQL